MTRQATLTLLALDGMAVLVLVVIAVRGIRAGNAAAGVEDVQDTITVPRQPLAPQPVAVAEEPWVVVAAPPPAREEPPSVLRLPDSHTASRDGGQRVLLRERSSAPVRRGSVRVPTPREQLDELRWRSG